MRLLLAAAVALVFLPIAARAQDAAAAAPPASSSAAVFARALDEESRPLAGAFEAQLTRSLIGRGLEVADFGQLFPAPPAASIEEGDALMEQGREAYNNLDPEAAFERFNEAAVFYARHPAETSPEKMARAFIAIGATSLLNGQPDRAREAFRRALTLQPDIEVESSLFGEDVRVGMEQARDQLAKATRGELRITSEPSGAAVLLDGRELGLTPLAPETAVVGRHHVIVKRPGFVSFGAFPELTAEKPVELRPVLDATPGYAEARALADRLIQPAALSTPELPPDAAKLGARTRSRFLVLAAISTLGGDRRRAEVQAWDLATGNKLEGLTVDLPDDDWRSTDQLAQQVGAWLTNPPPKAERRFALDAPPLLKKWWFWAAVGGAAAATVGVVAVSQQGPRPDFIVLGTP